MAMPDDLISTEASASLEEATFPDTRASEGTERFENRGTGRRSVLVVDDEEIVRRVVAMILEDDFDLYVAASAGEAIELYRRHADAIDLAVIDRHLRDINGLALREEMAGIRGPLPVILISGDHLDENDLSDSPCGPLEFIQKPFKPDFFSDRVHSFLERAARQPSRLH